MMNIHICPERPADITAIEAVTIAAFRDAPHTSHTEQCIVNALRRARALKLSLVAEADGAIVGHVAVSPVRISDGSAGWYGLGPALVLPEVLPEYFQALAFGAKIPAGTVTYHQAFNAQA